MSKAGPCPKAGTRPRRLGGCSRLACPALVLTMLMAEGARADAARPAFRARPESRLLVLAPHPDDETIAAGGLLAHTVAAGASAQVIFLTSGDGWPWALEAAWGMRAPGPNDFLAFGRLRMAEARTAGRRLGVPETKLRFLGLPDGGLEALWRGGPTVTTAFRSPTTAVEAVPYGDSVRPTVPYTWATAVELLEETLSRARPDVVILPHPADTHPDHAAAARFGMEAVCRLVGGRALARRTRVLFYLVHHDRWPEAEPPGPTTQRPPRRRDVPDTGWRRFPLDAESLTRKRAALEAYVTQLAASADFLRRFVRTDELFGRLKSRVVRALAPACGPGAPIRGR